MLTPTGPCRATDEERLRRGRGRRRKVDRGRERGARQAVGNVDRREVADVRDVGQRATMNADGWLRTWIGIGRARRGRSARGLSPAYSRVARAIAASFSGQLWTTNPRIASPAAPAGVDAVGERARPVPEAPASAERRMSRPVPGGVVGLAGRRSRPDAVAAAGLMASRPCVSGRTASGGSARRPRTERPRHAGRAAATAARRCPRPGSGRRGCVARRPGPGGSRWPAPVAAR